MNNEALNICMGGLHKEQLVLERLQGAFAGSADFPGWRGKYHEYSVASLNMKNLMSPTPRNCVLKALILALKDSADALVSLRSK